MGLDAKGLLNRVKLKKTTTSYFIFNKLYFLGLGGAAAVNAEIECSIPFKGNYFSFFIGNKTKPLCFVCFEFQYPTLNVSKTARNGVY